MLNQIVYVRGCFIVAARWAQAPGQPRLLDMHMGRHIVTRDGGWLLELQPLYTGAERIRVPASAVWCVGARTSEVP